MVFVDVCLVFVGVFSIWKCVFGRISLSLSCLGKIDNFDKYFPMYSFGVYIDEEDSVPGDPSTTEGQAWPFLSPNANDRDIFYNAML